MNLLLLLTILPFLAQILSRIAANYPHMLLSSRLPAGLEIKRHSPNHLHEENGEVEGLCLVRRDLEPVNCSAASWFVVAHTVAWTLVSLQTKHQSLMVGAVGSQRAIQLYSGKTNPGHTIRGVSSKSIR